MPIASQELIDRVSNVMLKGNYAMKRAVLRETPINPPHGDKSMFTTAQLSGATTHWQKLKMTDAADMIRFIKFGAVERDHIGALTFVTKKPSELATTASRVGWVPCWFLPWQSARILKLKIADVATSAQINFGVGIDPIPNPSLFFTAGINGCSVFAIGDTSAPSVYHGGIDPGSGLAMNLNPNETTEMAWRRMLGRAHTTKFVGSVGKSDYITELDDLATTDDTNRFRYNTFKTTRLAAQLEQQLEARGDLTKISVMPWGAVFGLRDDAGAWTFTLVKNVVVDSMKVVRTVKKRFFRPNKIVTTERGESRPTGTMPTDALGLLKLNDPNIVYTEQSLITCVNLGFSEFFPGGGESRIRNIPSVQVF